MGAGGLILELGSRIGASCIADGAALDGAAADGAATEDLLRLGGMMNKL